MNYYETSDLGLTATFVTLGYPVLNMLETNGKFMFTFEETEHTKDIVNDYFGNGVDVNAKSYYYNLRDLKKHIYATENTKR